MALHVSEKPKFTSVSNSEVYFGKNEVYFGFSNFGRIVYCTIYLPGGFIVQIMTMGHVMGCMRCEYQNKRTGRNFVIIVIIVSFQRSMSDIYTRPN